MKPSRIFISHSSLDKAFVQSVVASLRTSDMSPWIDREQIITGDDIFDQLEDGLRSMDVLIFLISQSSLESGWVDREVKFAAEREIKEKRILIFPFIIDGTPIDALPWFLNHRHAPHIGQNRGGVEFILTSLRTALERRTKKDTKRMPQNDTFKRSSQIDRILKNVNLGDWRAAGRAAIEIVVATDKSGDNHLFRALADYPNHLNDDDCWPILMTLESCIQLAPWLASRELLYSMGKHPNFAVRSAAASICLDLAQFAPDRVPFDILLGLSVHNEDWYVQAPATAALKSMAQSQPAILEVFLMRLRSNDPQARAHAASALADIAEREPEILNGEELTSELGRLEKLGDKESIDYVAKALSKVQIINKTIRYKYGI